MLFEIDADRKRPDGRPVARAPYGMLLGIHHGFQTPLDCFEEVAAEGGQMEAEQIVAEHPVQQLFFPGEGAEGLAIRPGNMPELGNGEVRIAFL